MIFARVMIFQIRNFGFSCSHMNPVMEGLIERIEPAAPADIYFLTLLIMLVDDSSPVVWRVEIENSPIELRISN